MEYSSYSTQMLATMLGMYFGVILFFLAVVLVLLILSVIGYWKVFKKAGQPGWGSLVPFYNSYLLCKITWGNGWMFLVPVVFSVFTWFFSGTIISSLFVCLSFAFACITNYKLATAFGKGIPFTVGLILLNWLFTLILGFSVAQYMGVPQDGCSYKQLNARIQNKNENMHFDTPNDDSDNNTDTKA